MAINSSNDIDDSDFLLESLRNDDSDFLLESVDKVDLIELPKNKELGERIEKIQISIFTFIILMVFWVILQGEHQ